MYYGHGSWLAVAAVAATFIIRYVMVQQRRAGRRPGPGARGFTSTGLPGGPPPPPGVAPPEAGATGTPPGWLRDPFFKHELRYWSGSAWTEHVTDGGVPSTDPPPERPQAR